MRIAIFTETFYPKVDGIANTVAHLLRYLADHGHESLMFAPKTAPSQYASTRIIRTPAMPMPFYPDLNLSIPIVKTEKRLTEFEPDIVHVVNPVFLGVNGIRHGRKLGVPIVASYHTDLPGFVSEWGLNRLVKPTWSALRWVHDKADLNLCPSDVTLKQLEAQNFKRLKVWSHGVDVETFNPNKRTRMWREILTDGHPNDPLMIFVSRLSPEKRPEWLRAIADAYPHVRIGIIGDGPSRPSLEKLMAGTNTVFTGFLLGDQLAAAYAAGDAFLFPSPHETFGNVVIEAMASGLPVVAARSGGPLDFMKDEHDGLFFEPSSVDDFVKVTGRLIHEPGLMETLSKQARASAEAQSWKAIFDHLIEDYQALVDRPPSRGFRRRKIKRLRRRVRIRRSVASRMPRNRRLM